MQNQMKEDSKKNIEKPIIAQDGDKEKIKWKRKIEEEIAKKVTERDYIKKIQ